MTVTPSDRTVTPSDRVVLALADFIIRRRWLVILATVALVAAAAAGGRFLEFSNNYRVFFSPDNPELKTAVELAPHDKEMQTRVQTLFANMRETLRNAIANGQKAGDITADVDATELALTLTAVLQGLAVFSRSGMSPDGMRSTFQTALRILD